MIDSKTLFGLLSSIFVLLGAIPYLRDIHYGKAHPHILSWLGWAFITALGGSATLAAQPTWAVTILFANTASCLLISGYAAIKKVGVWSTGFYDVIFFGIGVVGMVLWQVLDWPTIALVCAIVADFSFGLPTIIKTYKNPASETTFVWKCASLSGLLSIFALRSLAFTEAAYPVYLFVFDTTVLVLALKIIARVPRDRSTV